MIHLGNEPMQLSICYQVNFTVIFPIFQEKLGEFGPNVIKLLIEWTEMFPYDFRDERMMKHLKDMTQRVVNIYPELRRDVGMLMHNLLTKVSY